MSVDPQTNINFISLDEKLDIIRKIESRDILEEEGLNILRALIKDEIDEIRWTIAETLVTFEPNETIKDLLKSLSLDRNYLVRTNACDSMCIFNEIDIIYWLEQIIKKDRSELVRGYAALSISDISHNMGLKNDGSVELLKQKLKTEKSEWTKINYYSSLFKLGEKQYLPLLLNELNNRSYRNRCAVVNSIAGLIDCELIDNIEVISNMLQEKLSVETTIAVKSTINKLLGKINCK